MRERGNEKKKDPASIPWILSAVLRRLVCRVEVGEGGLQDFSVIMASTVVGFGLAQSSVTDIKDPGRKCTRSERLSVRLLVDWRGAEEDKLILF